MRRSVFLSSCLTYNTPYSNRLVAACAAFKKILKYIRHIDTQPYLNFGEAKAFSQTQSTFKRNLLLTKCRQGFLRSTTSVSTCVVCHTQICHVTHRLRFLDMCNQPDAPIWISLIRKIHSSISSSTKKSIGLAIIESISSILSFQAALFSEHNSSYRQSTS